VEFHRTSKKLTPEREAEAQRIAEIIAQGRIAPGARLLVSKRDEELLGIWILKFVAEFMNG
jgi:hypothetical protein